MLRSFGFFERRRPVLWASEMSFADGNNDNAAASFPHEMHGRYHDLLRFQRAPSFLQLG